MAYDTQFVDPNQNRRRMPPVLEILSRILRPQVSPVPDVSPVMYGAEDDSGRPMVSPKAMPEPMAPPEVESRPMVAPMNMGNTAGPRHPVYNELDAVNEQMMPLLEPPKPVSRTRNIMSRIAGGVMGGLAGGQAGAGVRREITGEAGRERNLRDLYTKKNFLQEMAARIGQEETQRIARQRMESEQRENEAQTALYNAQAAQVGKAKPEAPKAESTIETADGVFQWNPETQRYDIKVGAPKKSAGSGSEARTIRTGNRIKQFNPETGRYDIDVGPSAANEGPPPRRSMEFETFKDLFTKQHGREPTLDEWRDYVAETAEAKRRPDKDVAIMDTMIEDLNYLEQLAQNSEAIGWWDNLQESLKSPFVGNDPDIAELRRITGNLSDMLLRARSGAQINEQEYARLVKLVPQPSDHENNFKVKLKSLRGELQRLATRRRGAGRGAPAPENPLNPRPRMRNPQTGEIVEWNGSAWVKVQ